MVDTGAEVNIMTKTAATRLGISYSGSNTQLRTVHAPTTPVSGVAHGLSITLGECQGKTNFTLSPLDLFDIILGQEFFLQCHTVIDPYLQQLLVIEQGGTCIFPMVKAPKKEGQVRLTAMKLKKNPKKEKLTYLATITSLNEHNGDKKSYTPCTKKVPRGNNVVMPKKLSRRLPPRMEVDCEAELKEIKKQLNELHERIDRVN
ncbi:hypothetical protein EJD97_013091 [Solanum chilense]|uniref:Uncharacterized protein n=1 Tax=Solanum chilense TaxID=4083 RepID=A0A6N2CE83_SOLCI|nr:hypothetical protein EJD97_013091 [Solanum chilense]